MCSQSVSFNKVLVDEFSIHTQNGCCEGNVDKEDVTKKVEDMEQEDKQEKEYDERDEREEREEQEKEREEQEERVDKGWEMWISKMQGENEDDGNSYNFEAEELAVRLGTRVDKAGKLHAKILLQKIYHFWHCKQHTDMVLMAGSAREEAHLHMFLAHTEFYEKVVMIPNSEKMWKEGRLVLDMTGMVEPKALKTIVSYVYTGAIKLTLENVTEIAMAAKAMGLRRLQHQCTEFLDYIFSDFHLFAILRSFPVENKFFDVAWTKILKRFRKVSCEIGFLEMKIDELEFLISSEKLEIESEYQAFKPVIQWINHDRRPRLQYFFKLMAQIRFAYMDLEELITCMQDEELFRTDPEAQKILEDADMYATMESMGDEWCNYPPWPPRNEIIRRKVEKRRGKLAKLQPKTKDEISNESLPCDLKTNYGCSFDSDYTEGSPIENSEKIDKFKKAKEKAFFKTRELINFTDSNECYQQSLLNRKVLEAKEISTNQTQPLAQLRTSDTAERSDQKTPEKKENFLSEETNGKRDSSGPFLMKTLIRQTFRYENGFRKGPSEISLPSCMLNNRKS